jgi:orotate phosphoribosyltransferase
MGSAVEALRKAGCAVKEAVALVDRQEGARTMLAAHGVTLNSFVGIRDLAESLYGSKGITKAHYEAVIKQMQKTAD